MGLVRGVDASTPIPSAWVGPILQPLTPTPGVHTHSDEASPRHTPGGNKRSHDAPFTLRSFREETGSEPRAQPSPAPLRGTSCN